MACIACMDYWRAATFARTYYDGSICLLRHVGGWTRCEQLVFYVRSGHTVCKAATAEGDGHRAAHIPWSVGIPATLPPTFTSCDRLMEYFESFPIFHKKFTSSI